MSGPAGETPRFRVRAAALADAEALAEHRVRLFRAVLPAARQSEAEALREPSRAALAELIGEGTTLAWLGSPAEGGDDVGSLVMHLVRRLPSPASTSGREGYIVHVYVDEPWRGSGLGAALLAEAEQEARARGFSRIRLHSAPDALRFYLREGYKLRTHDMERMLR